MRGKRLQAEDTRTVVLREPGLLNDLSREFDIYITNFPLDPERRSGPWACGIECLEFTRPFEHEDMDRLAPRKLYKYSYARGINEEGKPKVFYTLVIPPFGIKTYCRDIPIASAEEQE